MSQLIHKSHLGVNLKLSQLRKLLREPCKVYCDVLIAEDVLCVQVVKGDLLAAYGSADGETLTGLMTFHGIKNNQLFLHPAH